MRFLICATLIVGISTPAMAANFFKKGRTANLTIINDCDGAATFTVTQSGVQTPRNRLLEPQESWAIEITVRGELGGGESTFVTANKVGSLAREFITLSVGDSVIYLVDCEGNFTEIPAGSASTAPLREFSVLASAMTGLCCLGFIGSFFGRAPRSEDDENASPADDLDVE